MITRVRLRNFKRFRDQSFDLSDHIVLAGPNNSGKSTLLQALSVWNLALERWKSQPHDKSAKRGLPVTRKDFTAIPLREMSMLWTDSSTALKKNEPEGKPGFPRIMEIEVTGKTDALNWDLAFEFRFQGEEQIYVKPRREHAESLANLAASVGFVHIPPFSGIGVDETRYDRPYQDRLVGLGKPGDILRNLLLSVYADDRASWKSMASRVRELFHCELLDPKYEGLPYIVCEYRQLNRDGSPKGPNLDISCGGSGFHQVLLLLAFFYARPSTVLLLDEPDAHLHVILQKNVYDTLRSIAAERRCQLVVATHSEVLIDSTTPTSILSFLGAPHPLLADTDRDQIREALRRLSGLDLLLAENARGVLYVEGETDFNLLKAWAKALGHPSYEWFAERPFWHSNQGRHPREAKGHFFSLRGIRPTARGMLLLDGDNRNLPEREISADGLEILRWRRYEAESYLVNINVLERFATARVGPLFAGLGMEYLRDELPPSVIRDPTGEHAFLAGSPVSKTLLPEFFRRAGAEISKAEYYQIAESMLPSEIPVEVSEKLDRMHAALALLKGMAEEEPTSEPD